MGTLTYDSKITAQFDDRVLAHLQIVVWAKLRRGEQFAFSWTDTERNGYGRTSVWLSPGISLAFQYFGSKMPLINRQWIDELTIAANSAGGLVLTPEPTTQA